MIKTFIITALAALVGCSHAPQGAGTDAPGTPSDGRHGDGSGGNTDAASAYVCTPSPHYSASCCVFGSACSSGFGGSGSGCYYNYMLDSADTSPNQGAGECGTPIETPLPLGATCDVNTIPGFAEHMCGVGAWCAYDANTSTQNQNAGICRQLCDPLDQAAHGCPSATTCIGMLYCANFSDWPNCPSATNTHLGYCVP
jgi:hypothetical protein